LFLCHNIDIFIIFNNTFSKKRAKLRKKIDICKFLWIIFVFCGKKKQKQSFDKIRTLRTGRVMIRIIIY